MKCWICGDKADTGEHIIKKSDLRMRFGSPSQAKPLFYHSSDRSNIPIGSLNNWRLKSPAKICAYCNNTRTQPYDLAWENLSAALKSRVGELEIGQKIKADRIFSYNTRNAMLNVHLYFVKLFGCVISAADTPIEIEPFSNALLNVKNHPNIYLRIGLDKLSNTPQGVALSEITAQNSDNKTKVAAWFYQIGEVVVNVMFVLDGWKCEGLLDAWHPSHTNNFSIADNFYSSEADD